ncbi:putative ribosomal protein S2, eukaryotic/archaeal [Helianthus anomalus]
MRYVDIGIPANNKGKHSIGCLFWLLARMVLQMRGVINQGHKWDVMVYLFFYREPGEAKKEEDETAIVISNFIKKMPHKQETCLQIVRYTLGHSKPILHVPF